MKLRVKLLVLPAIGGVSLLLLCALVSVLLHRANGELETLADVRFANYAAAFDILGEVASIQADGYRALVRIDALKADAVKAQREMLAARTVAVARQIDALKARVAGAESSGLGALAADVAKYGKALDDAIDMASIDPNTGMAAMQTADGHYRTVAQLAGSLVDSERRQASASVAEAKVRDRRNIVILWIGALAALAGAFALSIVFNRRLLAPLDAAREAAEKIAAGDLRVRLPEPGRDEIGQLITALRRMTAHLAGTIGAIKGASGEIAAASGEIAIGNNDLSRRTEQQAASLQQTSSSMTQLTGTVSTNADSARQANQLALGASEVARRGGEVVQQVVVTMGEISDSSRKIADIIGVIDGIAFQTNILALNAAVEAARAGEQGRGFAVVAGEVRGLAQRSADAARQIKGLIEDSVRRVDSGGRLVEDAGTTMAEIVGSVRRVTDIIGEITSATEEQSTGIGQVNAAVGELDRMTQQNAALVEQSTAAAESLKEQARRLADVVEAFVLDGSDAKPGGTRSPAQATQTDVPATSIRGAVPASATPTVSAQSVPPRARISPAKRTPAAATGTPALAKSQSTPTTGIPPSADAKATVPTSPTIPTTPTKPPSASAAPVERAQGAPSAPPRTLGRATPRAKPAADPSTPRKSAEGPSTRSNPPPAAGADDNWEEF